MLPEILACLGTLDITIIAATAGNKLPSATPANAYVAQYLPGSDAARRASLVICNGGSPTCQQAIAAGVPVIGIASNLDQFLNMGTLVHAGVGEIMRADRFNGRKLATLVAKILSEAKYATAARKTAATIAGYDSASRFAAIIDAVLGEARPNTGATRRIACC